MDFHLQRGINLWAWAKGPRPFQYGYDPAVWVSRDDVRKCVDIGADHVRLPIHETIMWDDSGEPVETIWAVVRDLVDSCLDDGLRCIVDLHTLRTHHFNNPDGRQLFTNPGEPARFAGLWRDLSAKLKEYPVGQVAYELMNEAVAEHDEDWNRAYRPAYEALRELEPGRTIVLGSNRWNQAVTFNGLDIPEGDPNLILTFHYYNPMHITHYRAPFVAQCAAYDGPIQYPGQPISDGELAKLDSETRALVAYHNRFGDASVMQADLVQVLTAREKTGYPVFCGEFGVIENTPRDIARRWAFDFREVLDSHGIPWTVWCYHGRFGIFDENGRLRGVGEALFGQDG